MKATCTEPTHNATWYPGKELVNSWTASVISKGNIVSPVRAICCMGKSANSSVVYASIWIHGKKIETSGKGNVGGYGYHKESAAIQEALDSAGVKLSEDIDGRGDAAIRHALEACVRMAGYRGKVAVTR